MKIEEAANILKKMYVQAQPKEKALSIHLFGIKYSKEISGMSLNEIVDRAELNKSYRTEIRKGINLAKYVTILK